MVATSTSTAVATVADPITDYTGFSSTELAARCNELHIGVERAARQGVAAGVEVGQLLIEARRRCDGPREYAAWCECSLTFGKRMAQKYRRLAALWPVVLARSSGGTLSMNGALALLADNHEDDSELVRVQPSEVGIADDHHAEPVEDNQPDPPASGTTNPGAVEPGAVEPVAAEPGDDPAGDDEDADIDWRLIGPGTADSGDAGQSDDEEASAEEVDTCQADDDGNTTAATRKNPGPMKSIALSLEAIERQLDLIDNAAKSQGHLVSVHSLTLRKQVRLARATLETWQHSAE